MKRKYWVLIGLVFILGFTVGIFYEERFGSPSGGTAFVSGGEGILEAGESGEITGIEVRVNDAYVQETEGEPIVVIDVSFFNTSGSSKQIAPMNTLLVDSEGYHYEHDPHFGDQRLIGGQLRDGGQRRGTLAYQIPRIEPTFEWVYTNHTSGAQKSWVINVSEAGG